MKTQILSSLLLMLLFVSCERYEDVNIDVPYKNKLVAVTFIGAGTDSVALSLMRTGPVFGESSTNLVPVSDAEVLLQTPNETLRLEYNPLTDLYEGILTTAALAGETYAISVTHNNEQVSGSTTIQGNITPVIEVTTDSLEQEGYQWYTYTMRVKTQEPGQHYLFASAWVQFSDSSVQTLYHELFLESAILTCGPDKEASFRFRAMKPSPDVYPVHLEIMPIVGNEAYSRYHNSLQNLDIGLIGTDGAEPGIIYSNMSNRIGVIASYKLLPVIALDF